MAGQPISQMPLVAGSRSYWSFISFITSAKVYRVSSSIVQAATHN